MARIRTIKPGFFKNEELAELPAIVRLLFIGLWTLADKEGRLEDRPKRIKAELFPYDSTEVDQQLSRLQSAGFIVRYEVGEMKVIQIIGFIKHQRITGTEAQTESEYPPFEEGNTLETPTKHFGNTLDDRKGKEGKGKEGKGDTREYFDVDSKNYVPVDERKKFVPPDLDEVKRYFAEKGFREDVAIRAYNGYSEANWYDSKGKKIQNWKQKMNHVWFDEKNKIDGTNKLNIPNGYKSKVATNIAATDGLEEFITQEYGDANSSNPGG